MNLSYRHVVCLSASHGSAFSPFLPSWTRVSAVLCSGARLHQLVTWRLCAPRPNMEAGLSSTWRVTHQVSGTSTENDLNDIILKIFSHLCRSWVSWSDIFKCIKSLRLWRFDVFEFLTVTWQLATVSRPLNAAVATRLGGGNQDVLRDKHVTFLCQPVFMKALSFKPDYIFNIKSFITTLWCL